MNLDIQTKYMKNLPRSEREKFEKLVTELGSVGDAIKVMHDSVVVEDGGGFHTDMDGTEMERFFEREGAEDDLWG